MSCFQSIIECRLQTIMESTELQVSIKTALEQERWSEVVELVSQTNWQNEALMPAEAVALSEALFMISGKESMASKYAKLFIDFYGNIEEVKTLKGIIGRYYEWKGNQDKDDSNYQEAIDWYEAAISYLTYKPSTKLRAETALLNCKQLLKEKKEREAEARRKLEKEEAAEAAAKQKREAERNTFLAKSLGDVEGLSTAAINRLAAADINTLWDLKNTSLRKIDDLPGIGNVLISEIKAYKTKHNLDKADSYFKDAKDFVDAAEAFLKNPDL